MTASTSLAEFTCKLAECVSAVDSRTEGQYGDGIGSEGEERQIELLTEELKSRDNGYQDLQREVSYPDTSRRCDIVLPEGMAVEAKLLRYWRANGDPEEYMYSHVFSPFNDNTLLTDTKKLHDSAFDSPQGLLGLFYERSDQDPAEVSALPDQFTGENLAQKVVHDCDYWFDFDVDVCEIAHFDDLRHEVHKQGAVMSWIIG